MSTMIGYSLSPATVNEVSLCLFHRRSNLTTHFNLLILITGAGARCKCPDIVHGAVMRHAALRPKCFSKIPGGFFGN